MHRLLDHHRSRQVTAAIVFVLLGAGLAGCNTTEGFGKDVKNTGQTIQDTAEQNKPQ